jgi:hypothetical protein
MRRLSPSSSCCPRICETRSGPSFSPYLSGKFNISMAKAQIFRIGECSCKTMAALSCVPNPLTLPLGLIFALDYAYITFHDPNLCEPVPSSTRRQALSLSLFLAILILSQYELYCRSKPRAPCRDSGHCARAVECWPSESASTAQLGWSVDLLARYQSCSPQT